jgi:hypothetical protein
MAFLERLWDKFLDKPERNSTIMAIIFLFQIIPLFIPMGFPMPYSYYTTDFMAVMDGGTTSYGTTFAGIQPGDIVVWGSLDEHASSWSSARDLWATPVMLAVGEKGAHIILANFGFSSISIFNDLISRYINKFYPTLTYGEDYIIAEYMAGAEAAIKSFAENAGSVLDAVYRKPINSYPGFAQVNTFADVDLAWWTVIRTTDHDQFIRQWCTDYLSCDFIASTTYDVVAPYYGNIVKACWQYGHEMEKLIADSYGGKFLGEQIVRIEAQELGVIGFIPCLIWAFYVNWKRAIAEGVSLRPRVGERGQ